MGGRIAIQLEVYLPFRGAQPWRGQELVEAGTCVGELPPLLGLTEPDLAVLIDGRHRPPSTPLRTGERVTVLRQAEGGD